MCGWIRSLFLSICVQPRRIVCVLSCLLATGCGGDPPAPAPQANPFEAGGTLAPSSGSGRAISGSSNAGADRQVANSTSPADDFRIKAPVDMDKIGARKTKVSSKNPTNAGNSSQLPTGERGSAASADSKAYWPQFRGPTGMGTSEAAGLPLKWSDNENLAWKTELPGAGSSSPIVYGDKVFVTCFTGQPNSELEPLERSLICCDRTTGEIVWTSPPVQQAGDERPFTSFLARHGYASSTPATDGELVYVFWGSAGVAAYNFDGQLVWENRDDTGQQTHEWGSGSSPILFEDLVILNACTESGLLVALDKATGQRIWTAENVRRSWATPVLVTEPGGETELVLNMENTVVGLQPLTGDIRWWCTGISDYVCPSIVSEFGIVYAIGSRAGAALAVQAGEQGNVSNTNVIWRASKGSNVSSPVIHDGHLYWVSDRGTACCLRTFDGEVLAQKRVQTTDFYASVVLAEGRLYAVSRERGTFVLEASPDLKVLAHNTLTDDSMFNGSPAIAEGQLFLRSDRYLYALGTKD